MTSIYRLSKLDKNDDIIYIQMQEFIDYNFLIIGRSGSGKSATSKLLTGDPSITVANSLNQVTKTVKFYRGISHLIGSQQIRFGILDIPGLDRINNRFIIREVILRELKELQIDIHGIIYVASLTERDTVDRNKLFEFLEQLPWKTELKKNCVIPVLTKYDNLVFDSPEQDIDRTNQEFQTIFNSKGFGQAWNKRVYWVNFTKSLEFKIKINENIRLVNENQIEKLVDNAKKNRKNPLTLNNLKEYIKAEQKYIVESFIQNVRFGNIPNFWVKTSHQISLHIKVENKKYSENLTNVSASSIGLMLSQILKKDIPAPVSLVLLGIPMSLAFMNLTTKHSQHITDKTSFQQTSNCQIMNQYTEICTKINNELQSEWRQLNKLLDFYFEQNRLICTIMKKVQQEFKFFDISDLGLIEKSRESNSPAKQPKDYEYELHRQIPFHKTDSDLFWKFELKTPKNTEFIWEPVIEAVYRVKKFEQQTVIKAIEGFRLDFCKQ